ncbi:MAG: hypothetical protein LBB80_03610 [Treponema sp.]|nr:hypothetical protein [Treponema sp.]
MNKEDIPEVVYELRGKLINTVTKEEYQVRGVYPGGVITSISNDPDQWVAIDIPGVLNCKPQSIDGAYGGFMGLINKQLTYCDGKYIAHVSYYTYLHSISVCDLVGLESSGMGKEMRLAARARAKEAYISLCEKGILP